MFGVTQRNLGRLHQSSARFRQRARTPVLAIAGIACIRRARLELGSATRPHLVRNSVLRCIIIAQLPQSLELYYGALTPLAASVLRLDTTTRL